jgi:3-oxoacyl-[acyl-carrier-protein] synthase-3
MKVADSYVAATGLHLPPLRDLGEAVAAGDYPAEAQAATQLESIAVAAELHAPEMAVAAGREALAASGHRPEEVAILLHAYLASQGLPAWHAASFVHRNVLGGSCPAIEVGQMSNGGMGALLLAVSYLEATDDRPAALVTTADRFVEIPGGRWTFDDGLIPGDGATAWVISRAGGFARLRSVAVVSDTTLEEFHRGEAEFGNETSPELATTYRVRKEQYFRTHSAVETIAKFTDGSARAIADALGEAEVEQAEIDHWVFPNIGRGELETFYLRRLEIPLEETCWAFGRTIGHLGAGDQIAGLHHLRATGRLAEGDLCALVGIGAGFSWSCAVLEIVGGD